MSKRLSVGKKFLKKENADKIIVSSNLIKDSDISDCFFSKKITFDLPKVGSSIHFVTNRAFNAIEVIEKICENEIIDEAYIAIYSINKKAVNKIIELEKAGRIKKINFLFSTIRNDRGENLENAYSKIKRYRKFNIAFYYTHAKVMAVKTKENYYTIEMSCNLAQNARIENMTFFNSEKLFEFHKSWIKKLTDNISENEG